MGRRSGRGVRQQHTEEKIAAGETGEENARKEVECKSEARKVLTCQGSWTLIPYLQMLKFRSTKANH